MKNAFKLWETNRTLYQQFLQGLTLEQLNTIPKGFSNNLIWNLGHIIVAQQALLYKGAHLPMYIPDDLLAKYQPGTKPDGLATQEEADQLMHYLTSLIQTTLSDWEAGKFQSYTPRTTITGFALHSIEDAIEFNNYHEGMHLGYMMNIKKFV